MSGEVRRLHSPDYPAQEKSFTERASHLLANIDYRRADTAEQRQAIFRLRYEAYTREGAIPPNADKTFSDAYDDSDNAYLFGLYFQGQLASSLRLHVACKEQATFPSLDVFPDYLLPERKAGKVIVDSTRFVADEALARRHRGLPYITLRLCVLAAEYFGVDQLLAPVRVEHQAFYRRAFSHRVVCEARPYPRLAKPISLMTVHFPSVADDWYRRYPFFHSTPAERRRLFERSHASTAPRPKRTEAAQRVETGESAPFLSSCVGRNGRQPRRRTPDR
jgi:N-acyl-L-homoserine lactone synthetase